MLSVNSSTSVVGHLRCVDPLELGIGGSLRLTFRQSGQRGETQLPGAGPVLVRWRVIATCGD